MSSSVGILDEAKEFLIRKFKEKNQLQSTGKLVLYLL